MPGEALAGVACYGGILGRGRQLPMNEQIHSTISLKGLFH
jgi:hypothetical protein